MAEKHINVKKTEGVLWEFDLQVGSNTVSCAGEYQDSYQDWMARCPATGSPHPDLPALKLKGIKASRQPGELITVRLSYESNDPDANYPGREKGKIKRYSMEVGAGEEPILTSSLFATLSDTEKEAANELANSSKSTADFTAAAGKLTSTEGQLFLAKIRKGIDAYRNPSLIWVERFSTNTLDDVELSKILKTTSSPPGGAPSPGSERNYLRLPPVVSPHEDGETWDIENRWELSLKGKWDEDLYPAES